MGLLEIVILGLVFLLLYSTGWLFRIFQLLVGVLMNIGRSVLDNFIQDQVKQPEVKKKHKKSSRSGKKSSL